MEAGGDDDGEGGDPDVLAAEELTHEVHEGAGVFRHDAGKEAGDDLSQPDDGHGIGDVHGDVLQRNVFAAPEGSGLGDRLVCRLGAGLDFVDVGVLIVLAEELEAGKGDQHEEVDCHEQVVGHGSRSGQVLAGGILGRHGSEVHAAADVGAGHHRGDLGQTRGIAEGGTQQEVGDESTHRGTHSTDDPYDQHPAGVLPNAAEVTLQQQQGDAHRDDDPPDDIII